MTSAGVNIGQRDLGDGKSQCDHKIITVYNGVANLWENHHSDVKAQNKIFIIRIYLLICLILIYQPKLGQHRTFSTIDFTGFLPGRVLRELQEK